MIKGVNKRIIEINNPENDYFEKAILFINSSKLQESEPILNRSADIYFKSLQAKEARRLHRRFFFPSFLLKPWVMFLVGGALAFVITRFFF